MPHYNTAFTIDPAWRDTTHRAEPPWRSWCKSPTWKSIRRHRLADEPQCRQCAIEGRTVAASHVDHIEPHLGQWLLFFKYENTQSLCALTTTACISTKRSALTRPREQRTIRWVLGLELEGGKLLRLGEDAVGSVAALHVLVALLTW